MNEDNNMLIERTLGFIGIVKKSGMLICGEEQSLKAVQENKVRLLIIASDVSAGVKRRVENSVRAYSVRCMYLPYTAEQLGHTIGFKYCFVCAVLDTKIASELADRLAEMSEDDKDKLMAAKLKLARHRQIERQMKKKELDLELKDEAAKKKKEKKEQDAQSSNGMNELLDDIGKNRQIRKEKALCGNSDISNSMKGIEKERGSR